MPEPGLDRGGEAIGGERPRRHDAGGRERRGLLAHHADAGVRGDPLRGPAGEDGAVHGEHRAARHPRLVRHAEQQAAEQPQLGLEEAVRVGRFDGLEGVAADQLGEQVGLVGRRGAPGAHLHQRDTHAAFGERPGGFATGEAAADHGGGQPCAVDGAGSSTGTSTPHFRHLRKAPLALDCFVSAPT